MNAACRTRTQPATYATVSYTHLDVYKRQDLDHAGFTQLVADSIHERIPATERNDAALHGLLERLDYLPASADDAASMAALAAKVDALRNGDVLYH